MGEGKGNFYKVNVTGMTEAQFEWVCSQAVKKGTNRAVIMKALVTAAMEDGVGSHE